MNELNMPAVEAASGEEQDVQAYELAFHVLPTIAEGEVSTIFENIKASITKIGGVIQSEELPARFDLAFEISQFLEGRNRKFSSAYFGWVRFTLSPDKIGEVTEMVDGTKELLRHLLIRLTKIEEANPFYFHPAIADRVVETIIVEAEEEAVEVAPVEDEVVVAEKAEDGEEVKEAV
jgi:ribosomal protein S6